MSALQSLLAKVDALAPRFGRLQDDIAAMASRGRSGDYKGVMQNARLVCEALLRSVVRDELKQTVGKAMLDELVQKFRQPANAGLVPTTILAHVGTVQAWGNLSSHDHAGSLSDEAVRVGQEEALASLNSMVAILSWYAESRSMNAAVQEGAPAVQTKPNRWPRGTALVLLALSGVGAGALAMRNRSPQDASANGFSALDVVYATWREPPPPTFCRDASQSIRLAAIAADGQQLKLVEPVTPEVAYLRARAEFEAKKDQADVAGLLSTATGCTGFAAAHKLAGRFAVAKGDFTAAEVAFSRAVETAPAFMAARLGRLGLWLKDPAKLAQATAEAESLVAADPSSGKALLLRGQAKRMNGDATGAVVDFCKAKQFGEEAPCPR